VPSNAPEEELRRAAEGLERYAEALAAHPRLRYAHGYAESAMAGDVGAFFDQSPMIGLANPLAPPIAISQTGERSARGSVRFGSAYEGAPGCVHGGFVAAAFDEVLGFVQSLGGQPGMTGTLTIVYRKPTPLHTQLHFDGTLVRTEGRKIFTEGRLTAGDLLCAEATGIFVSIARERFEDLEVRRAELERERDQT
jgi:acyl-coenzyme A thioesterase PaaI-like protein